MSQIKPHTFLMRQWPFQVQGGEYSIPATMKKMIAIRITLLIIIICNFPLPSREWKVTAHFKVGILHFIPIMNICLKRSRDLYDNWGYPPFYAERRIDCQVDVFVQNRYMTIHF